MIGIFTLYLKDVKAGYAMTEAESADLYGTFIALVFLTPFIGGLLADPFCLNTAQNMTTTANIASRAAMGLFSPGEALKYKEV